MPMGLNQAGGRQWLLRPSSLLMSLISAVRGVLQLPAYSTMSVMWVVTSGGHLPQAGMGQTVS